LMAIINVTPDSFSGDGMDRDVGAAVAAGLQAVADGADLLDIGGESTRPRSQPVPEAEEFSRVIPVIKQLSRQTGIPLSVDTTKPRVAAAALAAGARVINDVSGLALSDKLARYAAAAGAGLVLMRFPGFPFNRPRTRPPEAGDLLAEVRAALATSVARALAAGVPPECLVLDPGFGFGLLAPDSIQLLRRLTELRGLGYPLLAGVSRKGFTGQPDRLPVEERQWGTAAAHALAIANGADLLRVHDVPAARRVARFTDLVVRGENVSNG
ncbi:MAG TPA: dihydropteroate synthase, partial [Chloroflexota bacterium]